MTRAAFALLGVVILGISAGGVYREVTPPGKSAGGASSPNIAAANGALESGRTGPVRTLPDLRFVDGTGAPRSLADFRGRVVLLNLWATWCVPCRKEMPALDRLQAALRGAGGGGGAASGRQGGVGAGG